MSLPIHGKGLPIVSEHVPRMTHATEMVGRHEAAALASCVVRRIDKYALICVKEGADCPPGSSGRPHWEAVTTLNMISQPVSGSGGGVSGKLYVTVWCE